MKRNEVIFPDLDGAILENAKFRREHLNYMKLSQKQLSEIEILEEGDNNG